MWIRILAVTMQVARPLTAWGIDIGNTLGTHMVYTSIAPRRPAPPISFRDRTVAHFVANPVNWTFRGLRRSVQPFLAGTHKRVASIESVYHVCAVDCIPCLCPVPTPALFPRRGNHHWLRLNKSLNGEHSPALEKVLPFPGGEGRGEGEHGFQLNCSDLVTFVTR